jgi:hypothetical protein
MICFIKNDGGRSDSGYVGRAGDCATRAIAIVTNRPYFKVYSELAWINMSMPKTRGRRTAGIHSAAHGIYTSSVLFRRYMIDLGFTWIPTMGIGTGCRVHLRSDELPKGRIIVKVSNHLAAVIDGVLHDIYDCSRNGTRCVYGYWRLEK